MNYTATYSPDDNKLRLYASARLDAETYNRVKAAGFKWAPQQQLFVAPMWTPEREDLLIELAGEIADEDTSLVDRAEDRAERFTEYSENRSRDAEQAHAAVHAIADNIPLGQPILVGHHSEKRARRDAEKIEAGMRRAVRMWDTANYWTSRAAAAIRHAKYKERPDVRARRIKGIESDKRKTERTKAQAEMCVKFWSGELKKKGGGFIEVTRESALWFCNYYDHVSHCFTLAEYPRQAPASTYEGSMSLWSALGGSDGEAAAVCTVEQAREISLRCHRHVVEQCTRWIAHYENRLAYERAMLADSGGTVADRTGPEVGGAVRCWSSPGHGRGWAYITKVNKVTVTIMDKPPYGERLYRQNMPFDKLIAVMSRAEVEAARAEGRITETEYKEGFFLLDAAPAEAAPAAAVTPTEKVSPETTLSEPSQAGLFEQMRQTLKEGVKVVSAPQLFPTPVTLADRMVQFARIEPGMRVLEPSAGTGRITAAILRAVKVQLTAVEVNHALASTLATHCPDVDVRCADFLSCNGDMGKFDRILMNPPFENRQDVSHIIHAVKMLKPGGKLVAICAGGPVQERILRPLAESHGGTWEPLPAGSFAESGTGVNAVLLTINAVPAAGLWTAVPRSLFEGIE
jgi:protein-L-isoaspartate O-methyltransferase